jgi:hypothetical protein
MKNTRNLSAHAEWMKVKKINRLKQIWINGRWEKSERT